MLFFVTLIAFALASESPQGDWHAGSGFEEMASSVRAEVEDYLAGLSFYKRPFARRALVRATAPCAHVGIHDDAHGLAIACDDRKVAVAPPNGEHVQFIGDDGRTLSLCHDIDADFTVVQTFTNRSGTRVNRFVRLDDGGLRMETTITSGLLNDPLRYIVSYQP